MTGAELVDSIGLVAGVLWLGGAVYWQLVSHRLCPVKYSVGMFIVGSSLIFGSSMLVLRSMPRLALVLGIVGNLLMLLLAIVVHLYLAYQLADEEEPGDAPPGGQPS